MVRSRLSTVDSRGQHIPALAFPICESHPSQCQSQVMSSTAVQPPPREILGWVLREGRSMKLKFGRGDSLSNTRSPRELRGSQW